MTSKADVPLDINENSLHILKKSHCIISSNGFPPNLIKSKHSLLIGKCTQKLHKFCVLFLFLFFVTLLEIGKPFYLILQWPSTILSKSVWKTAETKCSFVGIIIWNQYTKSLKVSFDSNVADLLVHSIFFSFFHYLVFVEYAEVKDLPSEIHRNKRWWWHTVCPWETYIPLGMKACHKPNNIIWWLTNKDQWAH